MSRTARALATIAATAVIFTGAGATTASAAPCHPHPDRCEQAAPTGTDHAPHRACSLAPLAWWCAATAPRNAR